MRLSGIAIVEQLPDIRIVSLEHSRAVPNVDEALLRVVVRVFVCQPEINILRETLIAGCYPRWIWGRVVSRRRIVFPVPMPLE